MGNRPTIKLMLLAGAGIVALSPAKAADTQEGSASETTQSGSSAEGQEDANQEILVTATRREMRLQDVPSSVSAIDAEKLADLRARDTQDYILTVPGVSFTDAGGGRQTFVIRGVPPLGSGATTAIYLDETPLGIDLRLFDVDRVEVLRGPQGTLYGKSSMGGAIRTITRKPDASRFEARVDGSLTKVRHGGIGGDANLALNVPLVADRLAIRGVFYHEVQPGFIDNYSVLRAPGSATAPSTTPAVALDLRDQNRGAQTTTGGRVALRFDVTPDLAITGTYLWQKDRYDGLSSEDVDLGRGRLRQGRLFDEQWRSDIQQANLTATFDAGFADFLSSSTWTRGQGGTQVDTTYVYGPFVQLFHDILFGPGTDVSNLRPLKLENDNRSRNFTQELRLTSKGVGALQWVAGAYYQKTRLRGEQHLTAPGVEEAFGSDFAPGDSLFDFYPDQRSEEIAAYAELTYRLTERLGATAGIRRYHVKSSFSDVQQGLFNNLERSEDEGSASETGNTYKFGLDFRAAPNVLFYLQAASGYRAGGPNQAVPPGGTPAIPKEYESDRLWQYEFGSRISAFRNRLTLNGSIFYIDWSDIQISQNDNRGFSGLFNIGKARSKGVELELTLRPVSGLEVGSSLTFTDAKLKSGFGNYQAGDRIPNIPEFSGNLNARYSHALSGGWSGYVQGSVTYVDDRESFTAAPGGGRRLLVLPDYTQVDGRIGVEQGPIEVSLFVRNLLDSRGQIGREANIGYERLQYVSPRTIGVSFRGDF